MPSIIYTKWTTIIKWEYWSVWGKSLAARLASFSTSLITSITETTTSDRYRRFSIAPGHFVFTTSKHLQLWLSKRRTCLSVLQGVMPKNGSGNLLSRLGLPMTNFELAYAESRCSGPPFLQPENLAKVVAGQRHLEPCLGLALTAFYGTGSGIPTRMWLWR